MVHQTQSTIVLVFAKLVDVVEVNGNSFVPAINDQEKVFFFPINEFDLQIITNYGQKNTYGAGMVTDGTEANGCVSMAHSPSSIIFHYLIFHQGQFLGHLHRFLLVV